MLIVTYLEAIYSLSTLRLTVYRAVSQFIKRCVEGTLVLLRTILNFMSFVCTKSRWSSTN
jgi:hypothetical protein